ncbi:hypothetical protein ABPG77_004657 [Micractinium sp. CCAP 211/92]
MHTTRSPIPTSILTLRSRNRLTILKYAPRVWSQLAELFPDRHASRPTCIAITPDLRESSSLCPAASTPGPEQAKATAAGHGQPAAGQGLTTAGQGQAAAGQGHAAGVKLPGADLFCFADTMHMVDAAHRHMRPGGLLLVLWTDPDLSDSFVLGMEEALEGAMPGYCRYDCQRDPAIWAPRLQLGGLFRLIDYSALPHTLSLPASALLDSLDSRAALRSALGSSGRRGFHARMQRLVDAHFGAGAAPGVAGEAFAVQAALGQAARDAPKDQWLTGRGVRSGGPSADGQAAANSPPHQQMVQLSLHTKAYLLARAAAVVPPVQGDSWAPRGQLEPERVCLFCGRPMAPD